MRTVTVLMVVSLIFGFTACPQQQQRAAHPGIDLSREEASIRATDAQWLAATKARDTDRAASFWSDDATILMPNSPPVIGKAAIRTYVADSFKSPDFSIVWSTDKVVVAASGDMAYSVGTAHATFRAGRQVVSAKNNGLVIWKKQRDDQWKAVVDIATPAAPAGRIKQIIRRSLGRTRRLLPKTRTAEE